MKAILLHLTLCIALTTVAVDSLFCDPKVHKYYHQQYGDCLDCEPCHPGEEPMEIKEWIASLSEEVFTSNGPTQCPRCVKCRPHYFNDKRGYRCTRCSNCTLHNKHEVKRCTATSNAECDGILPHQRSNVDTQHSSTPLHASHNNVFIAVMVIIVLFAGFIVYTVHKKRKKSKGKLRDTEQGIDSQYESETVQSGTRTETTYAFECNGDKIYTKSVTTDGENPEETCLKTIDNETQAESRIEEGNKEFKAADTTESFPNPSPKGSKELTFTADHMKLQESVKSSSPDSTTSCFPGISLPFRSRGINGRSSSPLPTSSDDEITPLVRNKRRNKRKRHNSESGTINNIINLGAESLFKSGGERIKTPRRRCFSDSVIDFEQDTVGSDCRSDGRKRNGSLHQTSYGETLLSQIPLDKNQQATLSKALVKNSNFKPFARNLGMTDDVIYEIGYNHSRDGIAEIAHQIIQGLVRQRSCLYKNDVISALNECNLAHLVEQLQL